MFSSMTLLILHLARNTHYSAFQSLVQYVDHAKPMRQGKDRFEDMLFGGGAQLKTKAIELAYEYSKK